MDSGVRSRLQVALNLMVGEGETWECLIKPTRADIADIANIPFFAPIPSKPTSSAEILSTASPAKWRPILHTPPAFPALPLSQRYDRTLQYRPNEGSKSRSCSVPCSNATSNANRRSQPEACLRGSYVLCIAASAKRQSSADLSPRGDAGPGERARGLELDSATFTLYSLDRWDGCFQPAAKVRL